MITIMIIIMLMIMIMTMAIAIPMGIVMIINHNFRCWGQFLESFDNQQAPKSCLLFIFKIEVSIVFQII